MIFFYSFYHFKADCSILYTRGQEIVLFKSLSNCKMRNKIMLRGGEGQYYLVLNNN